MLQGYHPDGDELRNSLLSHSPSGSGIVALPENPVKAKPLAGGWAVPLRL